MGIVKRMPLAVVNRMGLYYIPCNGFCNIAHGFLTMDFSQHDSAVVSLRSLYHAFIENMRLIDNVDFESSSRNICLALSLCAGKTIIAKTC